MTAADPVDRWIDALLDRHLTSLTPPEFYKAVRALSARYVERRDTMSRRRPTDSAGRRAAFSAYFAPLHLLTTRAILQELQRDTTPGVPKEERALLAFGTPGVLVDLGCGTGAASAGWALACAEPPAIIGIDRDAWALTEAGWNWKQLGLTGRTRRGDLVRGAASLLSNGARRSSSTAALFAWSVNELDPDGRSRLLPVIQQLAGSGVSVLIIEPIARSAAPWWDDWEGKLLAHGARANEWRLDFPLPPRLREIDEAAGFDRRELLARSLWIPNL